MRIKHAILLFCLLLSFGSQTYAQGTVEKVPLRQIVETLEDTFEYTFNFDENVMGDTFIVKPSESLSLEETLAYLTTNTHLNFTIIDDQFISIQRKVFSICGYVKDRETLQPLPFATVKAGAEYVITDENGYFSFAENSAVKMVTIQHLGFELKEIPISQFNDQSCNSILLDGTEMTLSQVLISGYLVKGINKLKTTGLEFDFTNFSTLPGLIETDVLQTVQALPGIQSSNETVSNITIRGGTHDQNLILWDGIKMYQSGHFFGLISAFNPQITQKVSLLKSGSGVEFSDGVSGTIAMRTDATINSEFKGNVGINLIDTSALFDVPVGSKSSVQIAGRTSINGLVNTPTYEAYFDRISQDTEVENNETSIVNSDKEFKFNDLSLRWNYALNEHHFFRLNFINIANSLSFNENSTLLNVPVSRRSSLSQNSFGAGIYYKGTWSNKLSTTVHIYETDYRLKANNSNILEDQRFLQENSVSETGALFKLDYRFSDRLVGLFGYQFKETEVTNLDDVDVPRFRLLISEVVREHSPFLQVSLSSNNQSMLVTGGVRHNYLDKFNTHIVEPRVAFNAKITKDFSVDISAERKHQITSQVINFQNDFLGIEKRRWQLSNDDDIPIIKSGQYTLGFNYSHKGWLVSMEGYGKEVKGITSQSQGFLNQFEFIPSSGSYRASGIDFLIRKQLKHTNIWGSYSYLNNTYDFPQLLASEFPSNLAIDHSINFGITHQFKNLILASGYNWRTGIPTTLPVAGLEVIDGSINYETPNSDSLPNYMRLDVSLRYQINMEHLRLEAGVAIWNVLNRTNELSKYYRPLNDGSAQEFLQTSLGLTPNAQLRCYF